ncbi:hypothetical protein WN943_024800 [Citrus x changshan-huyou]
MESMGCKHNAFSYSVLINGYSKNKEVVEAISLYREMLSKGIKPTVVTFNTLFLGHFHIGQVEQALKLFVQMHPNGVVPDSAQYLFFYFKLMHLYPLVDSSRSSLKDEVSFLDSDRSHGPGFSIYITRPDLDKLS